MTAKPAAAAATEATTMPSASTAMPAAATVRHCAGRHRCAKRDSRDDRNQSCRPPHESLSFC
jgi:hypothetical protein